MDWVKREYGLGKESMDWVKRENGLGNARV